MPKRKCAVASCRQYVELPQRYCSMHQGYDARAYNKHVRYNSENDKYSKFYHTTAWRKLRRYKLMLQPLCEVCLRNGTRTKADMVHHKVELRSPSGWEKRLELDNLESICYDCHNQQEHKYSHRNRK